MRLPIFRGPVGVSRSGCAPMPRVTVPFGMSGIERKTQRHKHGNQSQYNSEHCLPLHLPALITDCRPCGSLSLHYTPIHTFGNPAVSLLVSMRILKNKRSRGRRLERATESTAQRSRGKKSAPQRRKEKQKQPRISRINTDSFSWFGADIALLPSQGLPPAIVFVRIPQKNAPAKLAVWGICHQGALSCGIRTKTMQRKALAPGWAAERYPLISPTWFRGIRGCFFFFVSFAFHCASLR